MLSELQLRHCTEGAKRGMFFIHDLEDKKVLKVARNGRDCKAYAMILDFMGPATNPNWIVGRCCEEAYERGLLDEQEFDWLHSKVS